MAASLGTAGCNRIQRQRVYQ
jgi:hypothetical protein